MFQREVPKTLPCLTYFATVNAGGDESVNIYAFSFELEWNETFGNV